MSGEDKDIEDQLDDIFPDDQVEEAEFEEVKDETDPNLSEVDDNEDEPEPEELPGFESYEEWTAAGKDPDLFKGRKAYEAEYNRIQDNKDLKNQLSDLKNTMRSIADVTTKQREDMITKHEAELKTLLEQQVDDNDAQGALETKDKLNALEESKQEKTQPDVNPVVTEFINKHPILDEGSDQFNKEFYDDMVMFQTSALDQLSQRAMANLTDSQLTKINKMAYEKAQDMNKELFASPRKNRQTMTRDKRSGKKVKSDPSKKLKDIQIDDPRYSLNKNAASDMYDMLKDLDPEAAENYAKTVGGVQ